MNGGGSLRYAIGIDVGGSRIKAAIVDEKGNLYNSIVEETGHNRDVVISQILKFINKLVTVANHNPEINSPLLGVGISVTGQVDFSTGTIIAGLADKIPGWIGTPLKKIIEERINLPVLVDNDGKAAAIAELYFGGHGEFKDMVCLTLGSGVGSGIIINRELHRPSRGASGELGHMIIEASDLDSPGYLGRLESYVSSSALIRYAVEEIRKNKDSVLYKECGYNEKCLSPELIGEAAKKGDRAALKAIKKMAFYLGIGLANIATFISPDIIVLSGGLSRLGDLLLRPAIETMKKYSFGVTAKYTRVVISKLGPFSGVLGAAALVFRYIPRR